MENKREIDLVYLAAGVSSRFNYKPKALAEVGPHNETLIESSMNQALSSKFNSIFFVVGENTEPLMKLKLGNSYNGTPISYIKQNYDPKERDKPWGTTDAICSLKDIVKNPFVVCNGDDLYGEESFKILYNHLYLDKKDECASVSYNLIEVLPQKGLVNRAIFSEKQGYVSSIREKFEIGLENLNEKGLSKKDKCSMAIFALYPQTLIPLNYRLLNFKDKNKEDRNKECLSGTELSYLIESQQIDMRLYNTPSHWSGLTRPEDVATVRKYLNKKSN